MTRKDFNLIAETIRLQPSFGHSTLTARSIPRMSLTSMPFAIALLRLLHD